MGWEYLFIQSGQGSLTDCGHLKIHVSVCWKSGELGLCFILLRYIPEKLYMN